MVQVLEAQKTMECIKRLTTQGSTTTRTLLGRGTGGLKLALNRFYTCDHCGKQLDEMKDYTESNIDVFYECMQCDLCADCAKQLVKLVVGYVKNGSAADG